MIIQNPLKKEPSKPEIIPKDFIPDPKGKEKIEEIIRGLLKEKGITEDVNPEERKRQLKDQAKTLMEEK
jgi:hypothetical protein